MKFRLLLLPLAFCLSASCVKGNFCERRLALEEEECLPEIEQPHIADECVDTDKVMSECAVKNDEEYCEYYLWQNRAAARRYGYTVGDYLAPGNEYVDCLREAGLSE